MKLIRILIVLLMLGHVSLHAQTMTVSYQPSSMGTCLKTDTIVVKVTNSTLSTLTNLKFIPKLFGFNYTNLVPTTGVSVTNGSNIAPEFAISSITPGASVYIKYFIQPGCNSTSTFIGNELKNSSNTLIASINTSIINVVFPAVTLLGVSNTSVANQTPAGFLQNLYTGQQVIRSFNLQSTNSVVGLSQIRVFVINSNLHYKFIGVNKGLASVSTNKDTIVYLFNANDFTAVGDGDTILESGENFYFSDTMKIMSCNTSLPSNLGLKYFGSYSCFVPSNQFCAKSTDLNALGEAKVVPYNLAIHRVNTDNGLRSDGNNNNFRYCKSWTATTTFRNNTNNGGVPGAGVLYDLDILQSSSDWPFTENNQLIGFAKNNDGSYQYVIDSIQINGVKVNLKDTFSSASGTIFNLDTTNWSKVKKVVKLTPATYTSPISKGLKDLDGDGEIDDLAEGDSFAVKVFYRMNGNKFTSLVNNRTMEAYDDALVFSYQQAHTSVFYKNMCKELIVPRKQQNLFYNFHHFNQYEVGGTEDFYSGGTQHTMFIKYWNQYNFPYGFVDTHKLIFKTILPPGLNYVPNSVGKMSSTVPSKSYNANTSAPWLNAALQYEVNGPGDYDTVVFVFNNSVSTYNQLYTLPFKVEMDCASLSNSCADLYPLIPLVQDSIKSYISMQWVTDGSICYNELLMKDASPIRKHCPIDKKGFNIQDFTAKRQTIGYFPDYRVLKIPASSPYIDSIDYSQTIPYDTVKYSLRGFVKDTALSVGWFYVHFKNLYDNLDSIKILPTSTIKIYDVSSGSTYTYPIKNSQYIRPSSGNGDIVLALGAFVDSIRAAGNSTFKLGGSTGSTSYQPDSFLIELMGVLTHNTQQEPYLNTQRDINPIGELRMQQTQTNLDCDLWGRSLKVVQIYHGIPSVDYVPELSTTGVCDQNGHHLMRWYYWQVATPDYFPHETRYSIQLSDTMSFEYNPKYMDTIYGPYMYSILRFGMNPSNSGYFPDSNAFDRWVNFSNTSLPASQRLINRYPNRIVFRLDSIFPKMRPRYTSDEYHYYLIGFYFRPTCAFPLNIPYQYNYTTPSDLMGGPLVKSKCVYWHNRQMPRLFDSALVPVANQWRSYATQVTNPVHNISTNPSSANIASKDTIEWTVTVSNTSTIAMPKTWLDFRATSSNVFKVVDISTNTSMPISNYTVGAKSYSWSQIGNINANSSRQFKIYAKVSNCFNDTLKLREGFNCNYYPIDPETGYLAGYNYKCTDRENTASLPIQVLKGHIQLDGVSMTPSNGYFNLCDTVEVEFKLSNLGDVDLNSVMLTAEMPIFSTMILIPDSSMIKWPLTGTYQKLNVNPTISSGNYLFDLSTKFKNGFLQNRLVNGDSSKALIKMKFKTSCPFRTGVQILFRANAMQACGSPVNDLGFATNQFNVNGLPSSPTNTMLILEQGVKGYNVCADSGFIEFKIKHTSGNKSNRNQFIQIELPNTLSCDTSKITIQNAYKLVDSIPLIYNQGLKKIVEWRLDSTMVFGDSIKIRIRIISSKNTICGSRNIVKMSVLERIVLSAPCSIGGTCLVDMIQDSKNDSIDMKGPNIELLNLNVSSTPNPPLGELVTYSVQVKNTGKKTNNIALKLLGGTSMSDVITVLPSFSIDSGITLTKTGSIVVPYGKTCSLKVVIDTSSCSCNNYPELFSAYKPKSKLIDTTICSGQSVWIGNDSINSFTYIWNNGITKSKQYKTYINSTSSLTIDSNFVSIQRGGCSYIDSFIVKTHSNQFAKAGNDTFRNNCISDSLQIGSGFLSNHTYQWSPSTGLSASNVAQPWAKPSINTQYFLTVTNTLSGCIGYDTIQVNVVNSTLIASAKKYTRSCKGGGATISIGGSPSASSGSAPYTYQWTPSAMLNSSNIANPSMNTNQAGIFQIFLKVTDNSGCIAYDTALVIIDSLPKNPAGNDTFVCVSNTIQVGKPNQSKINYYWYPASLLSSSSVSNPQFSSSTPGTYTYILTVTDSTGICIYDDSLNIFVAQAKRDTIYQSICYGTSLVFNNASINAAGMYYDTLVSSKNCDSFITLILSIKDTSSKTIFDTICANQSRLFNGVLRTTSGTYKDTLVNAKGCDSFIYLKLHVKPISSYTYSATSCANVPYIFNGQSITTSGTYLDTLVNAKGCDSFVTLNLTVNSTSSFTLNTAICKGQVYSFNGINRTSSGTYLDTLVNAKNCDSFITLNLLVKDTSTKMIFDTICKNQIRPFNGSNLNTTGIYKDTLVNSLGCDSFLYLNLLVKDTSTKTIFDTICANQSRLFNGVLRTTSGTYKDTLVNAKGCDSFIYLKLHVKPISSYTYSATSCANVPYIFNGQSITTSGTYLDTLVNAKGCDSFITLNLTVNSTSSFTLNTAICKGQVYSFNGINRTSSGTYLDTLVNAKNCDSFITLNLTVKDTSTKMIFDTICKNQIRPFNGSNLNVTGIYKDTLVNSLGCDSFLYLNLLVKDTSSKTIFDTICANQSRLFNGVYQNLTGIYRDTLTNSQGCDSFLYLNLYVKPISITTINAGICQNDSYQFNSRILYFTGQYRDTFYNSVNCDSIVILNLTVNPLPTANAGINQLRVNCKADSVLLGSAAIANMSYFWSPNIDLSNNTIGQPWAKPSSDIDYILKVTNQTTNCIAWDTVKVTVQNVTVSANISKTNLNCFNDSSGKIIIHANGGYRPYQYWAINQTNPLPDSNVVGLKAGTAFYMVEDAKGCEFSDSFSLTEPSQLLINLVSKKNLKCYKENLGEIEVNVTGGTPNFNYTWSQTSQNSNKATNLAAGIHSLTVNDKNGCTATINETLTEPKDINIVASIANNKCYNESKGSIGINVTQASPPYTYKWSNDSNLAKISNLKAGIYTVTVFDNNLCKFTRIYSIQDPSKLVIDSIVTVPNGCSEMASGQISIYANGGTRSYWYSVDSGKRFSFDSVFTRLTAKKYQIIVTDANKCLVSKEDSVHGSSYLAIDYSPKDTTVNLGQEVPLRFSIKEGKAEWIKEIKWTPSEGLSCADCIEPIVNTFTTQTYKVRIQYLHDCYVEETVKIYILSQDTIYVPNAFAPEAINSEENKIFKIYGKNISSASLIIFNRWGEKLYETNNANMEGWDGKYKGEPQTTGNYVYTLEVEFLDGRRFTKFGEFYLIR